MSIIAFFRRQPTAKDRFHALLRPHIDIMYRMAYRWTHSQTDAEDLVQDILVKLAHKVDEMESIESLKPWLIKILYNRYVDLYRRQKVSPIEQVEPQNDEIESDLASRTAASGDDFAQFALRQSLEKALKTLDEHQQDVVLLHDMEGYSASEVAEILQISIGTVKSRLHRARAKLKEHLIKEQQ